MAGRRRGTGRPLRSVLKLERRRRALDAELAAAQTPAQQVAVSYDYFRGALIARPDLAPDAAATVVRVLIGHADHLYGNTTPTTTNPAERQAIA